MEKSSKMDHIKTIAEVNSISVAAEKLGISQPALSAYLKKKEKEFGTRLFDRSRQPLQLTEAGRAYLEYQAKASAAEKEFHQKVADLENLKTGQLTIGGAGFLNINYLPAALTEFRKEHPDIDIEIVDGKVPEITTAAWNGTVDVFLTPSKRDEDRFHHEKIAEETIYLVVPADWPINEELKVKAVKRNEKPVPLSAKEFRSLCEYPFLVLSDVQDIGRKMQEIFDRFGCTPKQTIRAEQTLTTLAMTMGGTGVSLISQSKMGRFIDTDRLVFYLADEAICHRGLYVAYPKNKYLSRAAEEFIKILKKVNHL